MNCRVCLSVFCCVCFLIEPSIVTELERRLYGETRGLELSCREFSASGQSDLIEALETVEASGIYIYMMLLYCLLSSARGEPTSLYVLFCRHSFQYTLVLNLLPIHSLEALFTLLYKLDSFIHIFNYHRTISHRNYEVYRPYCSCSGCCAYPRGCCSPWHGRDYQGDRTNCCS
jgi:hypothetical protein